MKSSTIWITVVVIVLVLMVCCCCSILFAGGIGGAAFAIFEKDGTDTYPFYEEEDGPVYSVTREEGSTEDVISTPMPYEEEQVDIVPTPLMMGEAADSEAYDTLSELQGALVPINDPRDLALRLEGKENIPETMDEDPKDYEVGDEEDFWVTNTDTNENTLVTTTLRYETDHAYFWIENGVDYSKRDLKDIAEAFENEIYPTNREFFGSEWTPGIDHDPHLYLVYVRGMGSMVAGYFSSVDSVHPLAHEYSNAHESFMISADNTMLYEEYTYGVLAHEFQHMIHWYQDRNESSWLNEGFSELSVLLNGYDVGGKDFLFAMEPDMSLNDWPNDPSATTPHYGAAFLFVTYFLDRFGEEATQALVANEDNAMDSVDNVLEELDIVDAITAEPIRADDVFRDWTIANYLHDSWAADGRYAYNNYFNAPMVSETEYYSQCPVNWQDRTVNQYGADYIYFDCQGSYTLQFEGATEVGVLPADAYSGSYAFWSNKGDESDMRLTREFDFSDVDGDLTLRFMTWYDLEEDYDYLYLLASEDGEDWEIITTPSGTDEDPSGNSYGWAYNGVSSGWFEEEVDISELAGKKVYLRFEYVTDAAVNGEGLLLDDLQIDEIDYSTDFEEDDGGWEAEGFVRIQNRLPQTFVLSLIKAGDEVEVEEIELNDDQTASVDFEIGDEWDYVTVVISGTTRFTRQPAVYRYSVQK